MGGGLTVLVLGMDTSTSQVSVALGSDQGLLAEVRLVGRRRHAEQLAPAVEYVLGQAGVELADVDAVAAGVGPGLFTGLRVGVTTAKVMAWALGVPVVGVSSLDLVAAQVPPVAGWVVAVTDARRGEVYTARYGNGGGGLDKVAGDRVVPPETLARELADLDGPVVVVGGGARAYPESWSGRPGIEIAPPRFDHPSPAALVELAVARCLGGECGPARDLQPVYLRKSDAEMQWSGPGG